MEKLAFERQADSPPGDMNFSSTRTLIINTDISDVSYSQLTKTDFLTVIFIPFTPTSPRGLFL